MDVLSDSVAIARAALLDPLGLGDPDLERLLNRLLGTGVDAADIYVQSSRLESWVLEDGIIKEGSHSIDLGAGLRSVSGEKTGFAYSEELSLPTLLEAADAARAIVRGGGEGRVRIGPAAPATPSSTRRSIP